jgi:predicted phage-related endonuclease
MNAPIGVERVPCASDDVWRALRKHCVTASTVGALFGEHDYETLFGLYQSKTGALDDDIGENEAIRRGRLLEPVAVQILREEHPDWIVRHNSGDARVFYHDSGSRIGATPDVEVTCPERGRGVVQVKSVERSLFKRKWGANGEVEPPFWIVLQALAEAELTGATWAAVAPIVVGWGVEMPLIEIPLRPGVMARVRKEVADFWRRVEDNDPPAPDYARDGDTIARLYADEDGSTVALDGWNRANEIAERDAALAEEIKVRTAERKAIKAELLDKIGASSVATLDGRVFATAKTVKRGACQVAATSYRDLRIKKGF